jgi:hypothetical protein
MEVAICWTRRNLQRLRIDVFRWQDVSEAAGRPFPIHISLATVAHPKREGTISGWNRQRTRSLPVTDMQETGSMMLRTQSHGGKLGRTDDVRGMHNVRRDFPILTRRVNDSPLVYLDTAASAQSLWPC